MEWWNIVFFCVIPIISVLIVFFAKRKLLWVSPLVSTALGIAVSILKMPTIINNAEHRAMFFLLVIPGHFVIGILLTIAAYFTAFLLQNNSNVHQCKR